MVAEEPFETLGNGRVSITLSRGGFWAVKAHGIPVVRTLTKTGRVAVSLRCALPRAKRMPCLRTLLRGNFLVESR